MLFFIFLAFELYYILLRKEWGMMYVVLCIIYSLDCINCMFSIYFFNKILDVGGWGFIFFVVRW